MNSATTPAGGSFSWFQLFKYTVYVLLAYNVFLFLQEETLASQHLFTDGIKFSELIRAFAATLDTGAWVVLLLLFELETSVLPDDKIKGGVKLALHGTRAIAYLVIIYAFYGYVVKCFGFYEFTPSSITDLCRAAGSNLSYMTDLDEFVQLSPANCTSLAASAQLFELAGSSIITDADSLSSTMRLAWTDVINAGNWLLILAILEIDVWLQLKGKLDGQVLTTSKIVKSVLYSILVGAAVYWGFAGDFLDFWDAMLWILAFVFIELNVFEWQAETLEKAASA